MREEPEPYRGPFVVLAPDPLGFRVSIEPPPIEGQHCTLVLATKDDAWRAARDLWTAGKLPFRDLTESNTARATEK